MEPWMASALNRPVGNFTFKVGEGQMIEDFDQAVLGMAAGEEKSFDATFPEDYRAEELQSKTLRFCDRA